MISAHTQKKPKSSIKQEERSNIHFKIMGIGNRRSSFSVKKVNPNTSLIVPDLIKEMKKSHFLLTDKGGAKKRKSVLVKNMEKFNNLKEVSFSPSKFKKPKLGFFNSP